MLFDSVMKSSFCYARKNFRTFVKLSFCYKPRFCYAFCYAFLLCSYHSAHAIRAAKPEITPKRYDAIIVSTIIYPP